MSGFSTGASFGSTNFTQLSAPNCYRPVVSCPASERKAREAAQKAIREADRAEAEAWSIQMEGYGRPAQPSPTIAQCLNGGYGWLEVECPRRKTRASIPLDAIRRPRDTPIWKLEAALKCRSFVSCRAMLNLLALSACSAQHTRANVQQPR